MFSLSANSKTNSRYSIKPENITAVSSTCNACRSKKRKCDGGLPYCTICIKSKIRDKDGLPCCVYSEKQRKKRAKNMLAASSTQSVASPNTSINGTQDFTHQPNVDVNQTESWNMPNPDSYFSISPGVFVDTKMFQNTFITPIEKVLDRPAIPAQQVFHEPSLTIIDSVYLTHLEQHLFHLSYIVLQAVPMSSTDKLHILSPTGVSPTMCKALKFALFATSVMFSNHPDLFPCGPDKISLKHRIDVARKYASRSIRCINQSLSQLNFVTIPDTFTKTVDPMFQLPFEPIDSCDLVRAMLCLAPFAYGIGEGGSAIRLIRNYSLSSNIL
ncbi:hypothetical protein BC833DRAFT_246349 [Globomyces pollinis-pini]|nr:hypothetical protein BC833DRAFT_246349 [Globomyces pollinis-pini]